MAMVRALLLTGCAVLAILGQSNAKLIEATPKNFYKLIKGTEYVFVTFYAPKDKIFKKIAPDLAATSKELKSIRDNVAFIKLNGMDAVEIARKYGVMGSPIMKLFKNGEVYREYLGDKNKAEMVKFIAKRTGPAPVPTKLHSLDEIKEATENNKLCVFGVFDDADTDAAGVFTAAAGIGDLDHIDFFSVSAGDIVSEAEQALEFLGTNGGYPRIVLITDFDDAPTVFDGDVSSSKEVTEFLTAASVPTILHVNKANAKAVFTNEIKHHLLLFLTYKSQQYESLQKEFAATAKKFRGQVLFLSVDTSDKDNEGIMSFFNLKKKDLPAVRIMHLEGDMSKFAMPTRTAKDITTTALDKFVQDYQSGKLHKHLRTQDTPKDWDAKQIKVLTGENFDSVAYDDNKHVLVEFYSPDCDICKKLAHLYEDIAENYKSKSDLIIAKVDAAQNEIDGIPIYEYPTFKFFPKGGGRNAMEVPVERTEEKLVPEMKTFLRKQLYGRKTEL